MSRQNIMINTTISKSSGVVLWSGFFIQCHQNTPKRSFFLLFKLHIKSNNILSSIWSYHPNISVCYISMFLQLHSQYAKENWIGPPFALFTTIYYVIILACKEHFHLDTTSYKAMIMPEILFGISYALIFPTSLEFIIAQSPHKI